jgi:PAS domain S-box-containing protein
MQEAATTSDEAAMPASLRFSSSVASASREPKSISLPTGFTIVELDYHIRAVNKRICDMLGYTEAELLATTFRALTYGDDLATSEEAEQMFLSGHADTQRILKRYVHKDGHLVWVSTTSSLIRDASGGPAYYVTEMVDLTPRREAEQALAESTAALRESEERFRCAFESAAIGFALIELDGRIRAANPALCAIFGYTPDEILQRAFSELSHPDDREATRALRGRLVSGEMSHFQMEKRYIHKDGHVIWAAIALAIVRLAQGPPYFVGQVMDITSRREIEDSLEKHRADLERSNAELASFAYVASHDLQQPLRTVSSYCHLLGERYKDILGPRGARWIGHIQDGVDRMQRLIGDLLQLAQLRKEGDGLALTDTGVIARRVSASLEREYELPGSVAIGTLPVLMADAAQLELLIQNLLDNAFKYRRVGIELLVRLDAQSSMEGADRTWEFSVIDNGIGFDMKHADEIFGMLKRLHSTDNYEGTGLGLTICQRIVERHGGRIWASSSPGKGASFHFTLPEHQPYTNTARTIAAAKSV